MNQIRAIRERLNVTQAQLAVGLDVSQGNISFYERGQGMPAKVAALLIAFAKQRGVALTYDEIYGDGKKKKVARSHA